MPSEEQTYRDGIRKDIKSLGNLLELRMTTFEHDTRDSLSRVEASQAEIQTQVRYTNGKVRKITVALIFLAGFVLGLGIVDAKVVLPLLGV